MLDSEKPATTILPSGWIATLRTWSSLPPKTMVRAAVGAEAGVERAVYGVQPHDGEVPVTRRLARQITGKTAGDNDPAVGLDRHAARLAW